MNSLFSFLWEQSRRGAVLFIKKFVLPSPRSGGASFSETPRALRSVRAAFASLSPFQKKSARFFLVLWGISTLGALFLVNSYFLVEVPAYGGMLREGIIGTPRFINPLLAISDTDRDITALVYSGLMRPMPAGELVPDLAEERPLVSEDGLTYTFTLKKELVWHDGKPITVDDVLFTITKVKDPALKSPKRANWEGVTAEKIDDRTLKIILEQPYSPFLENTATLGILPLHIWKKVSVEQFGFAKFNVEPIGSGPYKIETLHKDSSGIPVYYDLIPFGRFALGEPYIGTLRIRFYANETELLSALKQGEIEAVNAVTPEKAEAAIASPSTRLETYRLPRTFGVFLNQNQNAIFAEKPVREALAISLDRAEIVASVLRGYGTALTGPLPPGSLGFTEKFPSLEPRASSPQLEQAKNILKTAGWKLNEKTGVLVKKTKGGEVKLAFSLAVPETEELRAAAILAQKQWEKLGAEVTLRVFDAGDLQQNIIRPRKYDALFFGEIIGRESDPFAFWHSSQRNDPGLNIALYANKTVDALLYRGRTTLGDGKRAKIYEEFEEEIKKDIPALFVYSPDFLYIRPVHIQGIAAGTITVPSERFLDVHKWFIKTDKVWRIFK